MPLVKKLNINTRNNLIITTLLGLCCLITNSIFINDSAHANGTTTITSHVCQGGSKTPKLDTTNPANNEIVFNQNIVLALTTSWVRNLKIKQNNVLILDSNITNQDNILNHIPINNLRPLPDNNQLEMILTGGCPETTVSKFINIKFNNRNLTLNKKVTNQKSPSLSGLINDPQLKIVVFINTSSFTAINKGNGKWELPAGTIQPDLPDGTYDIKVEGIDPNTNNVVVSKLFSNYLTIDTIAPTGTVDLSDQFQERSPGFSGSIDDPTAKIEVGVNGKKYTAINKGDGTWHLPTNTIEQLANGAYDLIITFYDQAGNKTIVNTQIVINAPNSLSFLLPPNTGFLRIGQTNIPSWSIYLTIITASILAITIRKKFKLNTFI